MEYGIQLYSVRDITEKNLPGALEQIAALGYKSVEFAGFFGHSAADVKAMLDKNGLKVSGTHSRLQELVDDFEGTVAYHKAIGNKNFIIPYVELDTQAKLDKFVEQVNAIQPRLEAEGIHLGYHNHAMEFMSNADGSVPEEQIIYRTKLFLEIDTYFVFVALGDPIPVLNRLEDRIRFLHVKDGTKHDEGKPLGQGEAPVADVYAWATQKGMPMVVESETLTPDGMTEAKVCLEYLRTLE